MPETFTPLAWVNNTFPAINQSNLNRIEQGIESLDDRAASLELGVVTPVTVPYATSITVNATQGALFRCIAAGDLTLDAIVGGVDGQTIVVEIQASGAPRVLHFTGSTDTVTIAAGQWWVGTFRYVAPPTDSWLLDDGSGGGSGGSGNDLNVLAPQNVPYAATVTLNAASGALFRLAAPGNFTLANPINGTDGQAVVFEVLASGGARTVSFADSAPPVTIPTGSRWVATLRYNATDNVWMRVSGSGEAGSGSGAGTVVSLDGSPVTTLALGSEPITAADVGADPAGTAAAIVPPPGDHNLLAWSFDPMSVAGATIITGGVIYLIRVRLAGSTTVAGVACHVSTAGATLANCFMGLYDSTGSLIGVSADQSTGFAGGGLRNASLTTPPTVGSGHYYVAVLTNGTTQPILTRAANSAAINIGLTAPNLRWATFGTGQTALPATINLSSTVASSLSFWAGLV